LRGGVTGTGSGVRVNLRRVDARVEGRSVDDIIMPMRVGGGSISREESQPARGRGLVVAIMEIWDGNLNQFGGRATRRECRSDSGVR